MAKEFSGEQFQITEDEKIFNGPHSTIDAVTLSSGEHSLKLLRKKVKGHSNEFEAGALWHTELQKAGYPVFPTYRYDIKSETEYITDLRRDGTHQIIDFCNPSPIEKIYISNMDELEADLQKLLEKSADDDLVINEPNIFFDVEISTGIAKVVMGDLRELGYESDDKHHIPTHQMIFTHNQNIIREHLTRLKNIATEEK
ncbi:MAG: hypothetical protein RIT04_638 [Candidatus Parcubacteria bacterium]|jgi:hypothetical protein